MITKPKVITKCLMHSTHKPSIINMQVLQIFLLLFFTIYNAKAEFSDSDKIMLKYLSSKCIESANKHRKITHDVAYKVLHTNKYKGYSGTENHFDVTKLVYMSITFAGNSKKGDYWFADKPDKKYPITIKNDFQGNIELYNTKSNEIFIGKIIDGDIIGVWKNTENRSSYAFYLEHLEK